MVEVAEFVDPKLRPRRRTSIVSEKSIAVLPLVNSSGDPANEYFSDGMSEELISSLSRLQNLKVIGRSSSFQFKGKTENSKTVGESLAFTTCSKGACGVVGDGVKSKHLTFQRRAFPTATQR
jgi:TolB-like protein